MSAKFIKKNLEDNKEYICNICSEKINDDKIVSLKCDPEKHIFCYDCIFDWYNEIKKSKTYQNYTISRMCPICRNDGGFLPLYKDDIPIKDIHAKNCFKIPKPQSIHSLYQNGICGAKLKTKDGYCQSIGKQMYGGFCGKHKQNTVNLIIPENIQNTPITI
jgi:hypothetical protein